LEENDIEQDMIKILPEESVINVNEFVREEPEVEIALGDIINEDTKDDLLISEEISILNNESQNEQNEFYQEEPKKKKPKQAVIEQPTYTRGISV
jgi:hypothetical protein